ncbi:MAG: hypothetical protein MPEBLZ_04081 [Candidatus Methanoperedens nitroreducens]|uniref:Uncharacterized protein n=1 Tax=Candidatus Methanoperedens nitratireducens TaxID=1392998 RepID=A0A0P8CFM3_9EURY|nr:hypothetical protein [Candidatus Methanoperedens sp. BLZ2]KAB2945521.1 MAG: hypothetical protein F9K14_10860 [Candidatus Methanoperedens sp.]KPQ41372.1 MAG: hypothetical protein MPEBLZ_04081 [Candidatus Methanoperedens sp. BLZ1]MBZ0174772.1 hypothetical protein [Candidatus Methanoperedens nitroreducens]MCX9080117.1 hypothetical protein [Candidatus Methanoperedens sp.]
MVRLEREGNSFVFITGKTQPVQDINILINALSELRNGSPDASKIKEGLLYIDNSNESDIRNEIKNILKKALESKGTNV